MPDSTPTAKKLPSRKKLLIYPKFQLTLLLANTVILGVILLAVGIQTARSFGQLREMGITGKLPQNHPYFNLINYQANSVYFNLMIAFIGGSLISLILTLVLSHRLAGPIVRLRGYFASIAHGNVPIPKLSFRKGDFFSELPPVINDALDQLQKK